MTDEIPEIKKIERASLKPGDVLVLTIADEHPSDEARDRVMYGILGMLGDPAGVRLVVLAAGEKLEVITPEK